MRNLPAPPAPAALFPKASPRLTLTPAFPNARAQYPPGEWVSGCEPPIRLHWLLPGSYRFEVNATDEAGNWADEPSAKEWRVELEPGVAYARLTDGLFGQTSSGGGEFAFVVLEVRLA